MARTIPRPRSTSSTTRWCKAMDQSRNELRDDILNARRGLSGATVGGIVLSLGAALAVALGLWPRLSEYR